MEIGAIVEHFVCDYRGRIVAMANGLVHVLVDGVGVVEKTLHCLRPLNNLLTYNRLTYCGRAIILYG